MTYAGNFEDTFTKISEFNVFPHFKYYRQDKQHTNYIKYKMHREENLQSYSFLIQNGIYTYLST